MGILLGKIAVCHAEEWKIVVHYQVKDGLVKDTKTGLMWMRCSYGLKWDGMTCYGEEAEYYDGWRAMNIAKYFEYAGYRDWRLPTRNELKSLVYCSSGLIETDRADVSECKGNFTKPTIVKEVFPNTAAEVFLTSSPADFNNDLVWRVNFINGVDELDYKTLNVQFRLVRSGQ